MVKGTVSIIRHVQHLSNKMSIKHSIIYIIKYRIDSLITNSFFVFCFTILFFVCLNHLIIYIERWIFAMLGDRAPVVHLLWEVVERSNTRQMLASQLDETLKYGTLMIIL